MRSEALAPPTLKTKLVSKFDDKEKSPWNGCHKLIFYFLKPYKVNVRHKLKLYRIHKKIKKFKNTNLSFTLIH